MGKSATRITSADDIRNDLKRRLREGEFAPGAKLPSIRHLAGEYESRISTVHHAILGLRHENLVETRQGSGVFAAEQRSAVRRILLLHPSHGDEWADYSHAIASAFSGDPNTRLFIESTRPSDSSSSDSEIDIIREKVQAMIDEGLDIILFNGMRGFNCHWLAEFASSVQLVCFYDVSFKKSLPCAHVLSDWHHGGYIAMRHLIEVGARDILLTTHHEKPWRPTSIIRDGALAAAAESTHKINIRHFVASVNDDEDDIKNRIREMFQSPNRPDAVLGHADWLAARFVNTLIHLGISVPGDVAVSGYFNTPWIHLTAPPLTSISTEPEKIAAAIRDLCDSNDFSRNVAIKPRLVVQESTFSKGSK